MAANGNNHCLPSCSIVDLQAPAAFPSPVYAKHLPYRISPPSLLPYVSLPPCPFPRRVKDRVAPACKHELFPCPFSPLLVLSPTHCPLSFSRDVKDRVAPACKRELFKVMQDGANDFRADAQLYEACKEDAGKLCKDVKSGGGRVQACLVRGGAEEGDGARLGSSAEGSLWSVPRECSRRAW